MEPTVDRRWELADGSRWPTCATTCSSSSDLDRRTPTAPLGYAAAMSWWSKLLGQKPPAETLPAKLPPVETLPVKPPAAREAGPRAQWIPADKNRFGVPVLDLISITGSLLSTSTDPQRAAMAVSWRSTFVAELAIDVAVKQSVPCQLRYAVDRDLPDGFLFAPDAMEQKWAIVYRDQAIYMIRSWTAEVKAVGRARRDGDELVVERLDLVDDALRTFGDPVETFDWMIRAHALDERLPLPVSPEGAALLEAGPLSVMGVFGHVAGCAATRWAPPSQLRPLRSCGDLSTAVRGGHEARVLALAATGVPLDARAPVMGLTALHIAAINGSIPLVKRLLELGANPNVLGDRDASVLITAVVHSAPLEVLDLLVQHGAAPATPNADGFGMLHAIAETDHAQYLPWAIAQRLDLEARTRHGYTPLHIAAALGHVAALRALIAAGADRRARSPTGQTAHDIAVAEGKPAAAKSLEPGG